MRQVLQFPVAQTETQSRGRRNLTQHYTAWQLKKTKSLKNLRVQAPGISMASFEGCLHTLEALYSLPRSLQVPACCLGTEHLPSVGSGLGRLGSKHT